MPPGRPPKRPGEPELELESPNGGKCKIPRLERDRVAPNDFSSVVKSKLQSYTRTGQACDRCKVRLQTRAERRSECWTAIQDLVPRGRPWLVIKLSRHRHRHRHRPRHRYRHHCTSSAVSPSNCHTG
ncbi:hypothetical protein F4778DRAFT_287164 [Xylariomycetidae sp. FL2044]|nr:hypothetical protein F4778DRAFT_287164 [Xylariomycetidae sp. FL2044]